MAVAFESKSEITNSANATSITGDKPTGTVAGNLLIASLHTMGSNPTHLTPTGWNVVPNCGGIRDDTNTPRVSQFWRIAGESEPDTYTFEFSTTVSNRQSLGIARFSGTHQTSPIHISDSSTGTGATPVSPSVTTTIDGCMIWRSCTIRPAAQTITGMPSGYDSRWNFAVGGSASGHRNGMATTTQTSAGATSTASFTTSTAENWTSATIAIAPPDAPPSGDTRRFIIS